MRKRVRWLLAMVFVAATVAVVPGTPAQAGSSCSYPLCSETANRLPAGAYVAVARDWCGNAELLNQNNPPCGAGTLIDYIPSGATTPAHQDWDAFRVEIGCTVFFERYSVLDGWEGPEVAVAGTVHKWVRIHNDQTAYIQARTCGQNPPL